ncbi:MAG: hypothetical protein ABI823_18165, partial [Bryobacteraceae bacterium]
DGATNPEIAPEVHPITPPSENLQNNLHEVGFVRKEPVAEDETEEPAALSGPPDRRKIWKHPHPQPAKPQP